MIGRRSTIGLALLCAFAFCAFAAQSAMAQVGTKSTNTTAVTCVPEEEGEFEDAHCDVKVTPGTGDFEHAPISNDTTTEIDVTADKTKDKITTVEGKEVVDKTADPTTAKLNGILAGVNTEVICTKVASAIDEKTGKSLSNLHNVQTEGKHTVTGTVSVNFSECTVLKPAKCIVKEPIPTTATAVGVEELNRIVVDPPEKEGEKGKETVFKDRMGVEFVGEGSEGTFAELTFEHTAEKKCAITNGGKAFPVKGSVIATGKNVDKEPVNSGATAVYEDANEMETLSIGGKKASFTGTFTTTMFGGGNPIALTTVT